jgi:small-conductance mechanosensitive channel
LHAHMFLLTNSISLLGTATPIPTVSPTAIASALSPLTATDIALHRMPGVAGAVDTTLKIVLSSGTMLLALALGLFLRQICVHRLQRTILDAWAIQTLGILVIIPPLIVGGIIALALWDNLFSLISDLKASYNIDIYSIGFNLAETLILIALSIGLARTAKKLTMRGLGERRLNINTQTLLARAVYITVIILACFCILSIWQVPVGIPVAAIGVITVVATVALQDILKDLVAGFYLLLSRPFFIGDQISIAIGSTDYIGKVQNVELRATRLRLTSGEEVSIPNAIVFGSTVTNNTYFEERRATIAITIPVADFAPQETAYQISEALKDLETIIPKPEPVVLFTSLTEGKITLLAHFWVPSSQIIDISDAMHTLHALLPNAELAVREPKNEA